DSARKGSIMPYGSEMDSVPGIPDPARLEAWISANVPGHGRARLSGVMIISGGRSNLTYRLDLAGEARALVLRRPPLGHVLPTAHDMSREFRVLSALAGTSIPVPVPVAFCEDTEVVGAPFYLMGYVDGQVLRTRDDGNGLTAGQAQALSQGLVDMLAAIHGVDIEAVGLTGFGRPDGYLTRQLARWQRQWELSNSRPMPGYDDLVRRLSDGLPQSAEGTLVHGDLR